MTIEEKTYAVLSAASGVTTLCPASRIKPPGDWQGLVRPYIIHQSAGVNPTHIFGGRAALTGWGYRVSVFADTFSVARMLATAVVGALDGTHGEATYFWDEWVPQYEDDVNIHHITVGFEVHEAL